MNTTTPNRRKIYFAFKDLTIQQRLPVFICLLLLTVVVAFSWVSYLSVRKASMAIGAERVITLTDKLSAIFKQSLDRFAASVGAVASDNNIKAYLIAPNASDRAASLDTFRKYLKKDTANKLLQLVDSQNQVVLSSSYYGLQPRTIIDSLIMPGKGKPGYYTVGKIILFKGLMYYPTVAPVTGNNKTIGYLINWRLMKSTRQGVEQLGQLLGGNGKVYFGNDDQQFWTDMIRPVEKPPADLRKLQQVAQYSRKDGKPVIASMRKIPGSRLLVLVELSNASFLETAAIFLRWVTVIGIILVVAGSLGGWLMSRNITRPLHQLSLAAAAIADGDYSSPVEVDRNDELGKLAASFNIMAARVHAAQQELEQKVEERTKELQTAITDINDQKESERKKDEFISIASHELKTPLTTLKAFFQLAGREMPPQLKSHSFISNASRQLTRMERLIADLLDVSKINAGKMAYNLEEFDFDKALKDTIDNVQQISPGHKLVLERSAPVMIRADRHRIEQVIVNLLSNAIKYSPEADKVLINSVLHGNKLRVAIKDFGIGISKKHIDGLFNRYYRIDGSQNRFQGLGLGLFISSEIVKGHGGSVYVKSEPGNGSEFIFELPV